MLSGCEDKYGKPTFFGILFEGFTHGMLTPTERLQLTNSPTPLIVTKSPRSHAQQSPTDTVIPFLARQPDCSLTLIFSDQSGIPAAEYADVGSLLLSEVGLTPPANPFPQGCADNRRGVAAELGVALGARADGAYYGALVQDTGLLVTVASLAGGILSQTSITLTANSNEAVLEVASGDFNGDGKPDLVATIQGASEVLAVLLGNGDGTFAAPVRYPVSGIGSYVVVDDFNNHGKLDLATDTVDFTTSQILLTILPGNGDGSFGAPQVVAAVSGSSAGALVSTDFNNDGRRDIAVSTGLVFLGQSNGTFTPGPANPVSFGTSDFPLALAAGDFDGDGNVDLAVATVDGVAQLWRGKGDGSFTSPDLSYALIPVGTESLAAIDIDGDGRLDLVEGLASGGLIGPGYSSNGATQFLYGSGEGHFVSFPAYDRASTLLADFNGDGKLDLLGFGDATAGQTGFQPLLGAGDGSFTRGPFSQVGITPSNSTTGPTYLAVDLNGDHHVDVVAAGGTGLSSRLGNGDGSFQTTGTDLVLPFAGGSPVPGFVAADFNGDGKVDAAGIGNIQVANTSASGELLVFDGKGDGSFQASRVIDSGLFNPAGVVSADFDRDGHADLAVISRGLSFGSTPQPGDVRV